MHSQTQTTRFTLDRIFHPSDFSSASEVAFAHALKLALMAGAKLRLMHVALDQDERHWSDFPGIRAALVRWGLLPEGSPREAVEEIGLNVEKILARMADPVASMLHYLDEHPTDLIVLATHQYTGVTRWMHQVVAEPMARRARTMTLFIPQGVNGFIALDDGAVTLRRMLIPIDAVPRPQTAVNAAAGLARVLGCHEVAFTLVHVGTPGTMPVVHEPYQAGWAQTAWTWDRTVRRGGVVEQILDVSTAGSADLIVLATQGHHGGLDALRGSTSERLLRGARCPVLAVPAS